MALFGNRLDFLIRESQDKQTLGLPIGPDTSFIIAEALLASADVAVSRQIPTLNGGAIRECLEAIHYAEAHHGLVVDRVLLQNTINAVISQNAPVGHDYEVAWCIWAAITWVLHLDSAAAQEISTMENSVVAILALDAEQQGLITPGALSAAKWAARMTQDDLYEEEWLLAYEANVQGWLPSVGGGDHVAADTGFGFLKANGVKFYVANPVPIVPGALIYPP